MNPQNLIVGISKSDLFDCLSNDGSAWHVEGGGDRGERALALDARAQRLEDLRQGKRLEVHILWEQTNI